MRHRFDGMNRLDVVFVALREVVTAQQVGDLASIQPIVLLLARGYSLEHDGIRQARSCSRRRFEYFDYTGMDLPDGVLKKLYYKNALRIITGIDESAFPK